jgi:hypothetical protein
MIPLNHFNKLFLSKLGLSAVSFLSHIVISGFLDLTIFLPVVQQAFETDVFKTTVVSGNDALFKCEIPAHIGDLVGVSGWVDSQGQDLNRQGNNAAAEATSCSVPLVQFHSS